MGKTVKALNEAHTLKLHQEIRLNLAGLNVLHWSNAKPAAVMYKINVKHSRDGDFYAICQRDHTVSQHEMLPSLNPFMPNVGARFYKMSLL